MARYLKILLLTAIASGAFSAVSVSSASAVDVLTCSSSPCIITGEQVDLSSRNSLGVKGAAVETLCSNFTTFGPSTITTGASSIRIHPVYAACTTEPLGASPIDTTGCDYELTGTTDGNANTNGIAQTDATFGVKCNAGSSIKVTAPNCTISINETGNQNLLGVSYDNEIGFPNDILMTVTVDNITYTASGSLCDFAGVSTPGGSNMFLTERVTLKAYVDGAGNFENAQTDLTQSF